MKIPNGSVPGGESFSLPSFLGSCCGFNRSNLTPDNILGRIKLQVMGTGMGEGFPVPIAGEM